MSQSQEGPTPVRQPARESRKSNRSLLKIISLGCLFILLCTVLGTAALTFAGLFSGTPGNRNDYPSWSSDGRRIVFESDRKGNADIYVMDADGSHVTQLTKDLFARLYFSRSPIDGQPAWSPDGSRITFVSGRDNVMMTYMDMNIYVMDSDGSNVVQLTGKGSEEAKPSWSPSGQQIVYSSRDVFTSEGQLIENPNWDLYVIDVDGKNAVQLTNGPGNELEAAWSPDGRHIAFISDQNGSDFDIYVMNTDGTNVIQLTSDSANEFGPAWSPDSSQIAFNSDRNGNVQIYVMNADGSDVTLLTDDTSNSAYPAWSPDGSQILFESDRGDGNANLFLMNADGSSVIQLTGKD